MRCPVDESDTAVLALSLIMLFTGPVLFLALARRGSVTRAIDRIIVVVLVLLVLLLLVPHTVQSLGWSALLCLAIGYGLPGLLEALVRRSAQTLHLATLLLALAGLLLHALLDGAGLAGSEYRSGEVLAVAIILHRFGDGLMLWLIMQPVFGARSAWLMLGGMAVATVVGYAGSARVLPVADAELILVMQAVITGTIMHSLVHRGHLHGTSARHGASEQGNVEGGRPGA
jgi:hypothetical protein